MGKTTSDVFFYLIHCKILSFQILKTMSLLIQIIAANKWYFEPHLKDHQILLFAKKGWLLFTFFIHDKVVKMEDDNYSVITKAVERTVKKWIISVQLVALHLFHCSIHRSQNLKLAVHFQSCSENNVFFTVLAWQWVYSLIMAWASPCH